MLQKPVLKVLLVWAFSLQLPPWKDVRTLVICCLALWMTWCIFSTFSSVQLGRWPGSVKSSTDIWPVWNVSYCHHERLCKQRVLRAVITLGYCSCRMLSTPTHLNVICDRWQWYHTNSEHTNLAVASGTQLHCIWSSSLYMSGNHGLTSHTSFSLCHGLQHEMLLTGRRWRGVNYVKCPKCLVACMTGCHFWTIEMFM
jgi:hypothetical protein